MQKRTRLAVALISAVVAGLAIFSCSNPTTPQPETKKYVVSFNAQGGDPAPIEQTVEEGKKATRPTVDPAKDGFVFGGWFTAAGYAYDFAMPIMANAELSAKWLCEITFDPGEGSFASGSSTTEKITVEPNAPITAPAVARLGWNLAGWTVEPTAATPTIYSLQGGAAQSITLTAVWTKCLVIEFNSNGATSSTSYPTQYIMPGDKIVKPSVNPVKAGYIFRFWTTNGTSEFDFTANQTANVSLTAVYGLDISSVYASSYSKTITVSFPKGAKEPASGEVTLTARVNDTSTVPIVATLTDFTVYSYAAEATYTYTQIIPSSQDEALSIVVTASTSVAEKSSSAITIPRLLEATGFTAVAAEKSVALKWDSGPSNIADYKITYVNDLGVTQTIDDLSEYSTSKTIKGLQDDHEYSFTLFALDENQTWTKGVTVKATPKLTKVTSDWLFIQYMDGDNNLNDNLWVDINEMERGLYGKAAGVSAKVVVLWDGWAGNATENPTYGSESTRILELAAESSTNAYLSSSTKDLSHTAPWLASGEVDMSDQQTLENFLAWVNERYSATHVVLGFSNHGGGPRFAAQTVTLPDGRVVSKPSGRAMCWDESVGGTSFLSTNDVSTALQNCGYGTANKLGMIVLDVCLGGSVEEAYQYRNYADYFVASPNNIPGTGLDYVKLIGQLKTSDTLAIIGKRMVYDYRWANYFPDSQWDAFLAQYPNFTSSNVAMYYAGNTLSCVNLSKMDALKTAIDGLSDVLLGSGGDAAFTGLRDDSGNPVSMTYRNAIKELLMRPSSPMNYMGTFTWLYDLGCVAESIAYLSATTNNGTANGNAWAELNTAANNVTAALTAAIEYSWRDGYHNNNLYGNYLSSTPGSPYGLTICGETFASTTSGGKVTLIDGEFPSFYTADNLAFAASSWATLLDAWF